MKNKKRIIVIFMSLAAFILLSVTVSAAFMFIRKIDGTARPGQLQVTSQSFINYSASDLGEYNNTASSSVKEAYRIKGRLKGAYTKATDVTAANFNDDKYYTLTVLSVTKSQLSTAIGKETGTVSAIPAAFNAYQDYICVSYESSDIQTFYYDNHILQKNKNATDETIYNINLDFEKYYKVTATAATEFVAGTTYYKKYTGTTSSATTRFKAYATERLGYDEEDWSIPYLNQLGFEFSFTNTVDVYVRVHFEDAWLSEKTYLNDYSETKYVTKDKLADSTSPFQISSEGWYYDAGTNCSYFKSVISASNEVQSYSFDLDNSYFYIAGVGGNYREAVKVEISYYVDIVQANRAKAIWGIDPSKL